MNKNMNNKLYVPGAKQSINQMKYEIANEFGVSLAPDIAAKENGVVGGEITRCLIKKGMDKTSNFSNQSSKN